MRDQALCMQALTQERRENKRKDGSFRRFPAKNIVAKLVFVRMLLASVLQAAIKELYSSLRRLAGRAVCRTAVGGRTSIIDRRKQ